MNPFEVTPSIPEDYEDVHFKFEYGTIGSLGVQLVTRVSLASLTASIKNVLCSLGYYQVQYIKFRTSSLVKSSYQESEEKITLPEKADSGGTY